MATLIKTTYYVAMIIHKITYGRLEYDIEMKHPKLLVANKVTFLAHVICSMKLAEDTAPHTNLESQANKIFIIL